MACSIWHYQGVTSGGVTSTWNFEHLAVGINEWKCELFSYVPKLIPIRCGHGMLKLRSGRENALQGVLRPHSKPYASRVRRGLHPAYVYQIIDEVSRQRVAVRSS